MNHTNEGSKLYLYSITSVAILGGLLFGYDTAVISGAEKGLEAFFLTATDFQYDKVMHGITSSSALIGCVLGGALSGIFASRLGTPANSLRLAAVLFFLSALGSYYPEFLFFEYGKANMNLLITFNLYRILGGIGVGLASAVCPMYIAEIAPSNIRGTLVSCNQFAIIFGMLVVYFVNYLILGDHQNPVILKDAAGTLSVSSESDMWTVTEGWRYMFGSEAFPAAFFGMLLFFVPKTPRYLVMLNRSEGLFLLKKVMGATKAQEILAEIKATSQEKTEKLFTYGAAVIVIGILLSVFQQAIGINAVLYYAPRIFENAGAEGGGMMQTVIMGIVNIVFTLIAIFTVDRFGRKPLLIIGSVGMAVGAFAVALCDSMGIKGILPVLSVIVYAAFFMMSWGPICWVLISEIFPNTIRGKAVAIAVAFQWIFNYIVSSTFPALYDFSPMFAYSLYGIICVIAALFVWRWVPETKGKTLEDMSKLWKKR